MEKCSCWHYLGSGKEGECWGTKERDYCECGGDENKCDFYPEKRKENKTMNTCEMWLKAQEDGKTYYTGDVQYQKDTGLVEIGTDEPWDLGSWQSLDELMNEQWTAYQTMTKSEAEAKFNIKIVGD